MRAPAAIFALALSATLASAARAVEPSNRYAALPGSTKLKWSAASFRSTRDSAAISGWWFEGKPGAPVLVLFDRDRGNMADLLPAVKEFASRGFTVMTFDYRDFGPAGPGPADSLRQLLFASRWVNDAEGALHFARSKAGERLLFVWGQDLGGAIAVAAATRGSRKNADAVACEGLFRTLAELLHASGLAQIPQIAERHHLLVEPQDEPGAAVGSLMAPLHVTVGLKDDVYPAAVTQEVTRRSLSRIDRWIVPDGGHVGLERTPGYYDHVGTWFTRMAAMIKAAEPPPSDAQAR